MSSREIEAVYFIKPGKVEIKGTKITSPEEGEIQIQIKACGVCKGDVNVFKGIDLEWYQSTWGQPPIVAGHEGVGVVSEVGRNITDLNPGDKVTLVPGKSVSGHFSQYVNLPRTQIAKIPDTVKDFSQWIAEPQSCVINALYHTRIFPGENVIVIGCGFMGLLIIQALKGASVAGKIIGVDIDTEKLELARRFGAEETFNPDKKRDLLELIKSYSKNTDIIIEAAGTQQTLDLSTELVKVGAKIIIFAWHHGKRTINGTRWHLGGVRVLNAGPAIEPDFLRMFQGTVSLMKRGIFDLNLLVTHRMSYNEAQQLLEIAVEPKKHKYIKGVLMF